MRLIASSDGEEAVTRQNEESDSLDRLGMWVALLEAFAFQLVRAGPDFKNSEWLAPPARAAYRAFLWWAQEQTGSAEVPRSIPDAVREEPAATSQRGREMVGRLPSLIRIIVTYDLALSASWNDLQADFEHLWSHDLPLWIAEQPLSLESRPTEDANNGSPQPPAHDLR